MKVARFAQLLVALVLVAGLPSQVFAVEKLDLSVGLKTLPLLTDKLSGTVTMAVVYDPANAASKSEADAVKAIADAGLEGPGGIKITAALVSTAELGKMAGAKLGFVTKGACTTAVSSASASNGVLTMTTDLDCVKAGKCVLGVVSQPSVEIYYSKSAAEAAKIGFAQAFSMLAKQV